MQVTPVSKLAITSMIASQIQDLVVGGKLTVGEKLPSERILCENFGASRTAIREAVSGLISKGILERRNNGVFVRNVDNRMMLEPMNLLIAKGNISISDILEVRSILDIESAGIAARRATNEDLKNLEQCLIDLEKPDASEKQIRYMVADFHRLIVHMTHNPLLEDLYTVIFEILKNDPRSIEKLAESSKLHWDIFRMVQARDPHGAENAMRKHVKLVIASHGISTEEKE